MNYFLLINIPKHPGDIVKITMSHFGISRTAVIKHLQRLIRTKQVIRIGHTRGTQYYLASEKHFRQEYALKKGLREDDIWQNDVKSFFKGIPENVRNICYYGFTEMFNNAIDHSEGKNISIELEIGESDVTIIVADDGIGIFKKLSEVFHFESDKEALLQLTKGKVTTDPQNHTGEGLFFTSRAFGFFSISSGRTEFQRYDTPEGNDWCLVSSEKLSQKGTIVQMKLSRNSKKNLREIFDRFTDAETYEFDTTVPIVELSKEDDDVLISRSQAKRVTARLEEFKNVILDFKGVKTIGQGFADQVFRVFQNEHPDMRIEYRNANEDVEFMIKRSVVHQESSRP